MNVLVIPEDFRLDQYILKPVIEAMLRECGKPRAKVKILKDPLLGSVEAALDWTKIEEIIDRYRMVDLFILIVDRDGNVHRRTRLDDLEQQAGALVKFVAENAWQEIEVWALAARPVPWSWTEVRSEPHPKERYFEPFAESLELQNEPGRGRSTLGREAGSRYARVRQLCPEDVAALEERIRRLLVTE